VGSSRLFVCFFTSLLFLATSCQPYTADFSSHQGALLDDSSACTPAGSQPLEVNLDLEQLPTFHANLNHVERSVRNAAVKISDPLRRGHGSGTYVKMHGRYTVITAAHVVDKNLYMWVVGRDDEIVLGRVAYRDHKADLAVVVVPKLETRKAILFRPRKEADLAGSDVVYTGFPGKHDLLTIRGSIAGSRENYLIMHSYGWFGSSGSGVYDMHGRLLGVVSALDVAMFYTPQAIEDIVWVAAIWQLDLDIVKSRVLTEPEIPKQFPGAAAPRRGGLRD
jgi:S1-C subfamily serine protease